MRCSTVWAIMHAKMFYPTSKQYIVYVMVCMTQFFKLNDPASKHVLTRVSDVMEYMIGCNYAIAF